MQRKPEPTEGEETPDPDATETPEATEGEETPDPDATETPEATEGEETPDPDATETPEATEGEETPDTETTETPEVTEEEIDAMNPDRKVSFYVSWDGESAPELGDQITLHAQLSGYEGLTYKIRWQVKRSGGDWQDLGSYGETHTLTLTQENLDWLFRVAVDITDVEQE